LYGNFIKVAAASRVRRDLSVSLTELTTHSHPEPNSKSVEIFLQFPNARSWRHA